MNDTAWDNARKRAAAKWKEKHGANSHPGYEHLRVHDMKHTFGRRLRAAGVSFEDRQILLGHKTSSVTSHYSGAELHNLIEAANKVTATDSRSPTLTILKRKVA
jgi:integrase